MFCQDASDLLGLEKVKRLFQTLKPPYNRAHSRVLASFCPSGRAKKSLLVFRTAKMGSQCSPRPPGAPQLPSKAPNCPPSAFLGDL